MAFDPRIVDLLLRHEELCAAGHAPSPEELCRECPELLDQFRQQLGQLLAIGCFATVSGAEAPPPHPAGWAACPREWNGEGLRYRPLRFHDQGGLGEVWVARDEELNREVALKRIRQDRGHGNPDTRRRFLLEAEVAGRLEHPGIVPVHGLTYDADGQPCYAMRFIQGETLADAVKAFHEAGEGKGHDSGRRRLAFRDLLARFVAVCKTIAYAHSRGIIHRDLKPQNIMLGKYGETLVVDWGLAKPVERSEEARTTGEGTLLPDSKGDSATVEGEAMGSLPYMSPEQAEGLWTEVGPPSDVYGLGATLYVILTGQAPRQGTSEAELRRKARAGDATPPRQVKRDVPRALEAVCLKAIALRPEDRYASALDLANDVDRWLADEPVKAYRDPLTARIWRHLRRHRTRATAIATAVVLAIIGLSAWAILESAHDRKLAEAKWQKRAAEEVSEEQAALLGTIYANLGNVGKGWAAHAALSNTLAATEKLANEHPERADFKRLLIQGHLVLGTLYADAGATGEAEKSYKAALDLVDQFRENFPDTIELRRLEGAAYHNLGRVHADQGQPEPAERAYVNALRVRQGLAGEHDTAADYQADVAATQINLGALLADLKGRSDEAATADKQAIAILAGVVRVNSDVPGYQANLARAHHNLGLLHADADRHSPAKEEYDAALAIQRRLVEVAPGVPEYRSDLADTLTGLGRVASRQRQHEQALRLLAEARDIRRRLVQDYPWLLEYQSDLAASANNVGYAQFDLKQTAEARKSYEEAISLERKLVSAAPAVTRYEMKLAEYLDNLGAFLIDTNDLESAEVQLISALEIEERLVREHPDFTDYRVSLGGVCRNIASLMNRRGKATAALAWLDHSIAVLEITQAGAPENAIAREALGVAKVVRPTIAFKARFLSFKDSVPEWDRFLTLYNGMNRDFPRSQRAVALARRGEHAKAVAEAEALARGDGVSGETLFGVARAHAVAATAARKDAKLAAERRMELSDRYDRQAVEMLRRAKQAGWFDMASRREAVVSDGDFIQLAARADFKALLAELQDSPRGQGPPP
jgi:serine/threonine protein kinase